MLERIDTTADYKAEWWHFMTHKTQCLPSFVNVIDRPGPDQQKLCDWSDITHVTHYTLHVKFIAGEHYWHYGRACWALWHWSSTGATLVADFRKRDPLYGLIWGFLKLENFGILRQIAEPKSDYCWLTLYCRKNCTRIINLNLNN